MLLSSLFSPLSRVLELLDSSPSATCRNKIPLIHHTSKLLLSSLITLKGYSFGHDLFEGMVAAQQVGLSVNQLISYRYRIFCLTDRTTRSPWSTPPVRPLITLLRQADVFVSLHGSGEMNALFLRRGALKIQMRQRDFGTRAR